MAVVLSAPQGGFAGSAALVEKFVPWKKLVRQRGFAPAVSAVLRVELAPQEGFVP